MTSDTYQGVAARVAGRIAAMRRRRRTAVALADMSDLQLRDIGFTRDWRGDVVRLPSGMIR